MMRNDHFSMGKGKREEEGDEADEGVPVVKRLTMRGRGCYVSSEFPWPMTTVLAFNE